MVGDRSNAGKSGLSITRLIVIVVFFCAISAAFAVRLLYLQIHDRDELSEVITANNFKTAPLHAERGEVYDRNGNMLISNVASYNLEISRTTLANGASDEILSSLIDLLAEHNVIIPDNCPLTEKYPYSLDREYIFDDDKLRSFEKFITLSETDKSLLTGTDFYGFLTERYDIPEELINTDKGRKITAIRYDMETNDFSVSNPYILLRDIDDEIKTVVSEHGHELHGIEISKSYTRKYDMGATLCHVLGRVGTIYAEEAEEYIEQKGYPYNAIIGKDGVEKVFEDYLRGIDGTIRYEINENNEIVGSEVVKEPKEGYSVRLTIDAELQKVIEESIKRQIDVAVKNSVKENTLYAGEDCKSGAAVVMDVNTGELLASASVPGYDLNEFSEIFNSLRTDEDSRPLINRAMQGIYPPGSTFKMLTAAAALDTGVIEPGTYIYDKGEYDKYAPTYTPRCWLYINTKTTHGYVNVSDAIKVSCNYFFYTVADEMGIDTIVKYATDFGLGVKTGIELPELEGILASPEYKESRGYYWSPGDTLQMAIGQSDNAFTPIQLASYMSTVVNGGNRFKATIFKSADHYFTGTPIVENEPVILNKTHLSDETVEIIKTGMKSVVDDEGGTAKAVFAGKSYAGDIGGKTGTAQVSKGSDTVLFVGFAPYENPKIAVAVVIENGYRSARAASVAADIFDYYFETEGANEYRAGID